MVIFHSYVSLPEGNEVMGKPYHGDWDTNNIRIDPCETWWKWKLLRSPVGEEGSCFCKLKTIVAGDQLILLSWFKVGCQTMSIAIYMPNWLHPQHGLQSLNPRNGWLHSKPNMVGSTHKPKWAVCPWWLVASQQYDWFVACIGVRLPLKLYPNKNWGSWTQLLMVQFYPILSPHLGHHLFPWWSCHCGGYSPFPDTPE